MRTVTISDQHNEATATIDQRDISDTLEAWFADGPEDSANDIAEAIDTIGREYPSGTWLDAAKFLGITIEVAA